MTGISLDLKKGNFMKILRVGKATLIGLLGIISLFGLTINAAALEYDLQNLLANPDTEIIVGDKIFSDWYPIGGDPTNIISGSATMIPLDDQPLNPGLRFVASATLGSIDFAQAGLYYTVRVSADSKKLIKDNSLSLTSWNITMYDHDNDPELLNESTAYPYTLRIDEYVSNQPFQIPDSPVLLGAKTVQIDDPFDSIEFTPVDMLYVATIAQIEFEDGGPVVASNNFNGDGAVGVDLTIEQRFSQTPIPATVWLFGSGLIGLAGLRRRLKK